MELEYFLNENWLNILDWLLAFEVMHKKNLGQILHMKIDRKI